ncbi:RNA-binding S4 domain-containing protein [Apibacter adventoris]|uniref:RNA-binding S4 domain-containing protein n=1 Tax=Apibacter adventoris TaxID=1679466 RepID=UPI000CF717E9|nr:RNA-binding protein [Apibacter adventoris]PQL95152.1 RNA-binding protein [Apibacter adventoris]
MRIDKFLWCIRFYKTRALATEECKKNRIWMGDNALKPSKEVNIGEIYTIKKNQIEYKIEVLQIPSNRLGAKLVSLYRKDLTDTEQIEKLKTRNQEQSYYRQKGLGRPTKKDRRDLEDYISFDSPNKEDE